MDEDSAMTAKRIDWRSAALVALAVLLLVWAVLPGRDWGLPSAERNRIAFGKDRGTWRAPELSESEQREPWVYYPNALAGGEERTGVHPRSAFNPIRSYHPDEYVIMKSLSTMRPGEGKFFHGFFGWPAVQFYVVGAGLQAASWFGGVDLIPDADFYFQNPEKMADLYKVGRIITLVFAVGCVLVLCICARRLFGSEATGIAALALVLMPLFAINAHYMTADIPMLFWVCLTLLASVHILQGGGRWAYAAAGIFLGLAAGTRYQGGLAAWAILMAHVLRVPEMPSDPDMPLAKRLVFRITRERNIWLVAIVSLLVFLATNPYILIHTRQFAAEFLGEMRGSRNPNWGVFSMFIFAESGLGFMLALAALAALWMTILHRDREIVFVVLAFGVPAAFLWLRGPVMVRYMIPALPLPVLLIAWAFAAIHHRGCRIGKVAARWAAPVLAGAVLLFTAQQTFSYCRLFSDPEADTRTLAGQYIARQVRPGTTLGVVSEPWQFEMPPLRREAGRVKMVPPDTDALEEFKPSLFVSSDFQYPPLAIRGPLTPEEAEFWRAVNGEGRTYTILKRFEAWPALRKAFLVHGPHDMRYVNPVITLVMRVAIERPLDDPLREPALP